MLHREQALPVMLLIDTGNSMVAGAAYPLPAPIGDLTTHAYTFIVDFEVTTVKLQSLPCYCATLRQAARAATTLYETALADSDLHATQFTALQVLKSVPNLTTTELADTIGIDQTTATRTLALIRKAGLVAAAPGNDRRERRWALTSAGETTVRKLSPAWEAAQQAFEKQIGRAEAAALKKASYLAASKLAAS
jgi:DNA-binding MarR family transcriptional regulator